MNGLTTPEITMSTATAPQLDQLTGTYTIDPLHTRIGFEDSTQVNRKDRGLRWNTALDGGGILVSEKVTLEFDISATRDA